jgi:hypothetical protein
MKVVSIYILLILSVTFNFSIANSLDDIKNAKRHITHSNTYYWLSRERGNDLLDIKNSLFHANKAKAILKKLKSNSNITQLLNQSERLITEAQAQIGESSKTIGNFLPIIPFIIDQNLFIHRHGNPDKKALKASLKALVQSINFPKYEEIFMVVLDSTKSHKSEETAHNFLNSNTSYYVIPHHELASILTYEQLGLLYEKPIPKKIINRICEALNISGLGILRLYKKDYISNITYWNSDYQYFHVKTNLIYGKTTSNGFCEKANLKAFLLFLLILVCLPGTLLFNFYNKKLNSNSKGSFSPIWLGLLTAVFSIIVLFLTTKGFSLMGINTSISIKSPEGIGWTISFVLSISLLPILLAYIGSTKLNKVNVLLNNSETISSIMFGSNIGAFTYLIFLATDRYGYVYPLLICLPFIITTWILSLRFGMVYSKHMIDNEKISEVEYILLLFIMIFYHFFVLLFNYRFFLVASVSILVLMGLIKLLLAGFIKFRESTEPHSQLHDNDIETGIIWLQKEIKSPEFYYEFWKEEFKNAVDFIVNDSDDLFEVIFIEAEMGCGKTRAAKEIANEIVRLYSKKQIQVKVLFGDCEEFGHESDNMPYKPFTQAFNELLGIGRFLNPSEKAEKIKSGLIGVGLKTAMGATGLGALGSLLDSEQDGHTAKTNVKEIATVITETLIELSETKDKKKGKVVFIIDDVQWIDTDSYELLKLIFNFLESFNDNQVCLIFTHRPDLKNGNKKVKKLIRKYKKGNKLNVFYNIDQNTLDSKKIVGGLLQKFKFDYMTMQKLTEYFIGKGIYRPLHILQTIETMIGKKMIQPFADKFILPKHADLSLLPPPSDFQHMVEELISGLDHRLISILQCCAVLGRSFKASVIATIFKMDLLNLLDLLRTAEKCQIIKDIAEEDDAFDFVEKRMVGIFRDLKWSSRDNEFISQQVREYHKRFIQMKEKEIGIKKDKVTTDILPYRDILSLANHSYALKDISPDKAVYYSRLAGEKNYNRGMFGAAANNYNDAIEIIKENQTKVAFEEIIEVYISYGNCLIDQQSDTKLVDELIRKSNNLLKNKLLRTDSNKMDLKTELNIMEILNNYRKRNFDSALSMSKKMLKNDSLTSIQQLRIKFYYAASLSSNETEIRKDKHIKVLDEADGLLKTVISEFERIEILKVKSEAANNTGFLFLHSLKKPEQAMQFFHDAKELNAIPEINDQKGIAISHTGLGDAYDMLNQPEKAEQMFRINLEISNKNGDLQGVSISTSKIGALKLKKGNTAEGAERTKLITEAGQLYEQSLTTAEKQKDIINICFALSGLLECGVILNTNKWADYVIIKIKKISKIIDFANAPIFAINNLKKKLTQSPLNNENYKDCINLLEGTK